MPLNEYEFPTSKVANVQSQLEKLVAKNYYLHSSAKDAYRSVTKPLLLLVQGMKRGSCCSDWQKARFLLGLLQGLLLHNVTVHLLPCLASHALILCRSYLLAYNSHQLKDIFNVHTLDLVSVAKSFGFTQPPRVSVTGSVHDPAQHSEVASQMQAQSWMLVNLPCLPMYRLLWWISETCNSLSRGVGDAETIGQNQSLDSEEKSRMISCCLTPLTHVWCLTAHFNRCREQCDYP